MNKYKQYTDAELSFLKENRVLTRPELTRAFNRKFNKTKTCIQIKALCTRKGYLTGRTGCFKKGNIPATKGTKGLMRANITSFKKGNCPANHKPVGSERICSRDGYVLIKIAEPDKWRGKHIVIWEAAHGKVPKGSVIRFKDENPLNHELDNLAMITRHENLYLNRHNYKELPEELKPTIRAVAKLECIVYGLAQ